MVYTKKVNIKEVINMNTIIEWAEQNGIDATVNDDNTIYLHELDLTVWHDSHMYVVEDSVKLYTKQASIDGLIKELNTFL